MAGPQARPAPPVSRPAGPQRQPTSPLAQILQIPEQIAQAQRAAALVRRQITMKWAEVLRGEDKPDRAAWCERSIARIDEDYFTGDEPAELLRLGLAAPAIVDLKN